MNSQKFSFELTNIKTDALLDKGVDTDFSRILHKYRDYAIKAWTVQWKPAQRTNRIIYVLITPGREYRLAIEENCQPCSRS